MKTVILCVETNEKSKTDDVYIDKSIKYLYKVDNDVKLHYLHLGNKSSYNSKKVLREIESIKRIKKNNVFVVYCLDTDSYSTNPEDVELNDKITRFCSDNNFNIVWFCRDIEEVFWHKQVPHHEKLNESKRFNVSNGLGKASIETLSSKNFNKYKSNFILVFDKFLTKK